MSTKNLIKGMINKVKKQSIEPAKKAAIKLLAKYNFSPPIDLHKLAKALKIRIHYRIFPANCDGWVVALKPNFMNTKYLILVNSRRLAARQRFTIAHEIGHIVLNHVDKNQYTPLFKHDKIQVEDKFELHRDADIFASELLMPTSHLLKLVKQGKAKDIKKLCAFYQVSKQAMEIKLEEIKKFV